MNGDLSAETAPGKYSYSAICARLVDRFYALTVPNWVYHPTMQAIRNGFLFCLPLVTAGALAVLLNNLPLSGYQDFMKEVFGENWHKFGGLIWQGTFGVLSVPMLAGTSYHITVLHNQRHIDNPVSPVIVAPTSLTCLMVILPTDGENGILEYMGTQGLFVCILVAIISSQIFLRLARIRRLSMLIYSGGMEASIQQSLAFLLPGILTVALFAGFYLLFLTVFGISIHQAVHDAILFPFQFEGIQQMMDSSIPYVFLVDAFWFFGIHGTNVLDPLTTGLFEAAQQANQTALEMNLPLPNIATKIFLDMFVFIGGAGTSVCLLAALLIASKNSGSRRLAKISLVPGVFNINEILLFGLPVVLNPIFIVPFVLVPIVLTIISYMAVYYGLIPPPIQELSWTTPPILGGYFSTGSLSGSLLQVFNIALGTLIYIPFVRISDREKTARQKKAMQALMEIACNNAVGPSGKKCLDRNDEIGVLARALAHDLKHALKTNTGLYLEYQPQVDHETGTVIGAEALVRWKHPVYEAIPVPIMVAISEDGEFMCSLGIWVLNETCAERARWRDAGIDERFKLSVNVSIQQLGDNKLVEKVMACLDRHNLQSHMIGIEVTESIALDPESPQILVLKELSDMGFIISMDDFGMGHSSLVYLKYFPVDVLKIDRALSKDVATSNICVEVISTIVDLCRSLNVKIVVEYVENQEQIDVLLCLGCHVFQGYFYSPPVSGEKCLQYVQDMNRNREMR
ncbi:MAG: EAL domain-containing protein [Azoarcus sp.]|jgi:lactose/cellobiose-specific phosphotransferase system IIC component|nr:EAL domain-containing protein [Azoarcus sp.]